MTYYEELVEGAAADASPKAKEIVVALISDINDRSGLGFDMVDDSVVSEIIQAWISIVEERLVEL